MSRIHFSARMLDDASAPVVETWLMPFSMTR
jgi:hypothetical protein